MDDGELERRKRELRSAVRARVADLDDTARRNAAEGLANRLREWQGWHEARIVLSFLSTDDEIDTGPTHRLLLAEGKALGLPRIRGDALMFHRVRRPATIRSRNSFHIREPSRTLPLLTVGARTLILVPGVAFDTSGARLGRGRGYYDRLLAGLTGVTTIGVCHSIQIVSRVPVGPRDLPVQWIATELGVVGTGQEFSLL